jgi:hypothetical protein
MRHEAALTPPAIAKRYGVAHKKVREWIEAGELAALNLARSGCERPRYVIMPEAIQRFEQARQVVPVAPTPRRRRRTAAGIKEYF